MANLIYIIRHGQTDYNKQGIVQGRGIDSNLNDIGKAQANAFAQANKQVGFGAIYTSTLKRTHQTVAPTVEDTGLQPHQHEGLDEINWGIFEGKEKHTEEHKELYRILRLWNTGELHHKAPGGETPAEVWERQQPAIELNAQPSY